MTVVALVMSGAFTALAFAVRFAGASLVRTPRADALHDAAEGFPGAATVARLLEDRAAIIPSLGAVHAGLLLAGAIPATWAIATWLNDSALAVALVGTWLALVVLGDALPRALGRNRPAGPSYRFALLLDTVIRIGRRATDLIPDDVEAVEMPADPDDSHEIQLITQVLEFTDAIVREVMVPRTDMVTVGASDDTDQALDVVLECGRSRIPVIGDGLDDIVGILYARDLLTLFDTGGATRLVSQIMKEASFVPETKKVSELFREMQVEKVHMVVVVDEFGGTAGLVTMEDLLEEIVGEIVDEYDEEEILVQELGEGVFVVDGRLAVDDLEDLVGRDLPDGDWDTVGGLVLGLAGRVPEEGEDFRLESAVLTAERVQGRRVARVRVSSL